MVLLLGGTVVAMLWTLQRQLIYFPDPTRVPLPGTSSPVPATSRSTRPTASTWAPGSSPATGHVDTGMAVLVAPGNGGNRAGRAEFAES